MSDLTPEAQSVVDKAAKLLAVAAKSVHPEEIASFTAKAMALLEDHGLTVASVERAGDQSGRRKQEEVRGGMYGYQRELWRAVAELNFCMYYRIAHTVERRYPRTFADGSRSTVAFWGREHRHTLIGRIVNVTITRNLTEYLEQRIEALVRERFPLNSQRFLSEAVSFREGIADELVDRLRERRRQRLAEDSARQRQAAAGSETHLALTLGDLAQQEADANTDFIMGEDGYSARRRAERTAERAERARRAREAEEAYTAWATANPEEAARQAEQERKEQRRRDQRSSRRSWSYRGRAPSKEELRRESPYFRQGREAAASIGLDVQAEGKKSRGALTHG